MTQSRRFKLTKSLSLLFAFLFVFTALSTAFAPKTEAVWMDNDYDLRRDYLRISQVNISSKSLEAYVKMIDKEYASGKAAYGLVVVMVAATKNFKKAKDSFGFFEKLRLWITGGLKAAVEAKALDYYTDAQTQQYLSLYKSYLSQINADGWYKKAIEVLMTYEF